MDELIEKLKTALITIEDKYFVRNERDFSYELYYRLRSNKFPVNVEVSCETRKERFSFDDDIFSNPLIRKYFFGNNQNPNRDIWRYPDLLIHEYNNRNHQHLAIEIKQARNINNTSILKDLAKLIVYCRGRLKYEKGIFILINSNINFGAIPNEKTKEILFEFPEIEIWIVKPESIQILNANTLKQQ